MAVKGIAQMTGPVTYVDGEVTQDVYMRCYPGGESGTLPFGPVNPSGFTETAVVIWAKAYMNENWSANIGTFDTVKLVNGIGGLL